MKRRVRKGNKITTTKNEGGKDGRKINREKCTSFD